MKRKMACLVNDIESESKRVRLTLPSLSPSEEEFSEEEVIVDDPTVQCNRFDAPN